MSKEFYKDKKGIPCLTGYGIIKYITIGLITGIILVMVVIFVI